jgi:hypothetical protein
MGGAVEVTIRGCEPKMDQEEVVTRKEKLGIDIKGIVSLLREATARRGRSPGRVLA